MKNCKRKKHKPNCCVGYVNLAIPIVTACLFVMFGVVIMLCSGNLYKYNWILLPRGAIPLPSFIITFITVIGMLGGATGVIIAERFYRKISDKLLAVSITILTTVMFFIWYNILFSSFAFLGAFVFSMFIVCGAILSLVIGFKYFKTAVLLLVPVVLFSTYVLWLSFSVMLIN